MIEPLARARFVPPLIWIPTDTGYRSVDRIADPDAWIAAVEADEPVVTQVDDGSVPDLGTGRSATSSSSQPSVVDAMLVAAGLRDEHRVLEIGTGTGWTAGLLAQRVGAENVTTVELDPRVAAQAGAALHEAGLAPVIVVDDGRKGCPDRAPFDRVLATCAVTDIPWAWIDQTVVDGAVLTPWASAYHNGMLARVVRRDGRHAVGTFVDLPLAFMRMRSQRERPCPWETDGPAPARYSKTPLTSEEVYEMIAPPGAFAIGLVLANCHKVLDSDALVVRLHDLATGSWARCAVTVGAAEQEVAEGGPRNLWEEATAAHRWWVDKGRPRPDRFGLSVTEARQEVWLDSPAARLGVDLPHRL